MRLRPWLLLAIAFLLSLSSSLLAAEVSQAVSRHVLIAESIPGQIAQSTGPDRTLTQQADALTRQGAQQFRQRQLEAAFQSWEAALELYRQAENRVGEGRVLGNQGTVHEALGNYREAIAAFSDSLTLARDINDYEGIVFALNNLGHTHEQVAEYDTALTYQEEALQLTRDRGDRVGEQHTLNALGILYKETGDYPQAVVTYERSLALARELGDRAAEANVLGNLANAYSDLGNYPQAIALYAETLPLMQQANNPLGEAAVLQRMGNLYSELGNLTQALQYYEQSLDLARTWRDPALELYTLGSIGVLYRVEGDYETALRYLQEALQRGEQLGDRSALGPIYNSLGNTYLGLDEFETAQDWFRQSLRVAQEIGDPRLESIATGGLGLVADLTDDNVAALGFYQQSLALARDVGDRVRAGQALSNIGIVQYEIGDLPAAARSLYGAIAIWEALRPGLSSDDQVSLFETQASTYQVLQMVLIDLKRNEEALEVSERSRARAFVEMVAQRLSPQTAESLQTDPPTLEDIRAIARTQAATLVQYSLLENDRIAIWVIQPHGDIYFRETNLNVLDTTDLSVDDIAEETRVAAATGRGHRSTTSGVSAWVHNLRSFVTDPANTENAEAENLSDEELRSDPLPDEIRSAPSDRALDTTPDRPVSQERRSIRRLQRLHKLLIAPISDLLPTDPEDRVVIIPQGSLFLVPFAALQNESDQSYLIEHHTLLTAPAIQVLELTADRRQQLEAAGGDRPTLIVGNPTMPSIGSPPVPLAPLPNAETEAIEISQLLQGEALLGAVATESRVVRDMATAGIIHLATHGLLDDVEGLGVPGAIALAPSFTTDGFLTANEIINLRLNADLVVLSACDTGRGRITGDGVIGLSRSFISAGATSVVVSLWAVPDDATAVLMTEFYRNMADQPDKAQALRQAMLSAMQQFPSSRDWAAFTLIGEAD